MQMALQALAATSCGAALWLALKRALVLAFNMLDLFRHLRAHTPAQVDTDLGNLGEVIAFPPHGIRSLSCDPCDEVLPPSAAPKDRPTH